MKKQILISLNDNGTYEVRSFGGYSVFYDNLDSELIAKDVAPDKIHAALYLLVSNAKQLTGMNYADARNTNKD